LEKIYSQKFNFDFLNKKLLFTYSYASIKDGQATGEAFSPQIRTCSTWQNMKILFLFVIFVGHFCPPGSGS
jgi:hypothetical protein